MEAINTHLAPAAIGTYSQAIKIHNLIFLSGQIPLNPDTMTLCSTHIDEQIHQVFKNLTAVCGAAGGSLQNIVKLTVYLQDMNHFPRVNAIMETYFTAPFPARAVVGVNHLPRDAAVEMDGIMILPAD